MIKNQLIEILNLLKTYKDMQNLSEDEIVRDFYLDNDKYPLLIKNADKLYVLYNFNKFRKVKYSDDLIDLIEQVTQIDLQYLNDPNIVHSMNVIAQKNNITLKILVDNILYYNEAEGIENYLLIPELTTEKQKILLTQLNKYKKQKMMAISI